MADTTLARKLMLAPHLSLLQRKARRLGLEKPADWVALAVDRGCYHYFTGQTAKPVSPAALSSEELAALLLSAANTYTPLLVRVAAQLLSTPDTKIRALVQFCRQENALAPLAWIARAGAETEPENPFWQELGREIEEQSTRKINFPAAVFPHPSRFRIETGFQRFSTNKKVEKRWLRPIRKSS